MKAKEVHKLKDEEIKIEVDRLRKQLYDMRHQAVSEKVTNTAEAPKLRKDIARLLTERSARRQKAAAGR
jgi:ribosomal protein L29